MAYTDSIVVSSTKPQTDPTEGRKYDYGKSRYGLLPYRALKLQVDVLTFGATKYAPDNWRYVDNARDRYFDAAMRHMWDWKAGEYLDKESGLPHLAHALCCISFVLDLEAEQNETT